MLNCWLGETAGLVPASEASSGTTALSDLGMSGADSGAPPSRAGSPQVSSGAASAGGTGGADGSGSGATSRAGSGVGGEGGVAFGSVASSGDCTSPKSTSDFASFGVCPDSAGSTTPSGCVDSGAGSGSTCSAATGLVDSASCAAVSWASPSLPASPASCSGFHTGFGLSVSKPNAFGLVPTSHRTSSSSPVVSKTALWIVALCSGALSREASAPVLCPRTSVSSAIPKGWAPVRRMPATALVFDTVERILSQAFLMASMGCACTLVDAGWGGVDRVSGDSSDSRGFASTGASTTSGFSATLRASWASRARRWEGRSYFDDGVDAGAAGVGRAEGADSAGAGAACPPGSMSIFAQRISSSSLGLVAPLRLLRPSLRMPAIRGIRCESNSCACCRRISPRSVGASTSPRLTASGTAWSSMRSRRRSRRSSENFRGDRPASMTSSTVVKRLARSLVARAAIVASISVSSVTPRSMRAYW